MTNKLTDQEALDMLDRLSRHYGEPVMPVGRYCAAFRTWAEALQARQERRKGTDEERYDAQWLAGLQTAMMQISKSNFLFRLIYEGEKKRTRMCPVHEGRWSGMQGDPWNICVHGCDNTGWLPEEDDPKTERYRGFVAMFRELPVLTEEQARARVSDALSEITSTLGAPQMAAPQGKWLEPVAASAPDTEQAKIFFKHGLFLYDATVVRSSTDGPWEHVRTVGYRKSEHATERLHPQVRIVETTDG